MCDHRPVRVAIVTESFLPQMNGVVNSVLRTVDYLHANGHEALIIAPAAGQDEYNGAKVVKIPALDLPIVNSLPIGVPTRKILSAMREFEPDVVHLASPFVVGARGVMAANKLGVPSVAVYQTDVPAFAQAYGFGLASKACWVIVNRIHRAADRTLAPSTDAVRQLRRHGVPRVHRWARGVDIDRFSPDNRSEELRAELAPNGELIVGFVGRLAPEKQVERLAALDDVDGVQVVVVGDGPAMKSLKDKMPNAKFLGAQYGDELARTYASMDVFAHTGPYETFCQTAQEAMASGLPVIAPAAGGPCDLVDNGRTGYLIPVDRAEYADTLVDRVARLAADPDTRRNMGLAARRTVLGRTWPSICGELMQHYHAVIGRASGSERRVA